MQNKPTYKSLLCNSIINGTQCLYKKSCLYAHSFSEQIIDPEKKRLFNIIRNKTNISNIDIVAEQALYKTMLLFTKLCEKCVAGKCNGGYNCKNGVFDPQFVVCETDLKYGNCSAVPCNKKHLTIIGLKPYNKTNIIIKTKKYVDACLNTSGSSESIMLTDKYFSSSNNNNNNNISSSSNNNNGSSNNNNGSSISSSSSNNNNGSSISSSSSSSSSSNNNNGSSISSSNSNNSNSNITPNDVIKKPDPPLLPKNIIVNDIIDDEMYNIDTFNIREIENDENDDDVIDVCTISIFS
jgi:hypothetical protein